MIRRDDVRRLVREELQKRLAMTGQPRAHIHAALLEIYAGSECREDLDFPVRKDCVIEPGRPCYNSGYCKKLGY